MAKNIAVDSSEIYSFVLKEFTGMKVTIGEGYWFVPVCRKFGWRIHYEYNQGRVHMDIEGADWNWYEARYFFVDHVSHSRVKRKKWGSRNDCRWTLDFTPSNWEEIKCAFIEIRNIMAPTIRLFEQKYNRVEEFQSVEQDEVVARKVTVGELLTGYGLEIPDYQRPYRWTERNVQQLLQDVIHALLNGQRDYLIGSVILHTIEDKLDIVDGQQRLTTLCLILKALKADVGLPELKFNHSDSFFNIRNNFRYMEQWVSENLAEDTRIKFREFLLHNCQVVQIIVTKLNEAFQLFETQNGRGKPLEAYNLLKAYHIRAMTDTARQDKIECDVRWEDAASYFSLRGERHDLLRQVIN